MAVQFSWRCYLHNLSVAITATRVENYLTTLRSWAIRMVSPSSSFDHWAGWLLAWMERQCRYRLIGYYQLRLDYQCACDANTRPLTTGKFMRIPAGMLWVKPTLFSISTQSRRWEAFFIPRYFKPSSIISCTVMRGFSGSGIWISWKYYRSENGAVPCSLCWSHFHKPHGSRCGIVQRIMVRPVVVLRSRTRPQDQVSPSKIGMICHQLHLSLLFFRAFGSKSFKFSTSSVAFFPPSSVRLL